MLSIPDAIRRFESFFEDRPDLAENMILAAAKPIAVIPEQRVKVCSSCGYWPVSEALCPRCSRPGTITMTASSARTVETMVAAGRDV